MDPGTEAGHMVIHYVLQDFLTYTLKATFKVCRVPGRMYCRVVLATPSRNCAPGSSKAPGRWKEEGGG